MKTWNLLLISIFLCISCERSVDVRKPAYNENANELIKQVITKYHCECILEISEKSLIESSLEETPLKSKNIRQKLIAKLRLKNEMELDSLEKISDNFILDESFIERRKIKIISNETFKEKGFLTLSKECPQGIFWLKRPIFDSDYKTAALDFDLVYSCLSDIKIYKKEKEKWLIQ